ncbi:hypothetical protein JTE90_010690 [Oedothorax gibbosus]|uniref:Uncharacterized protein n=1 Tax=Oedothorax gibbosus TaxID=931172 RepID=A0AAV6UU64_9ARAC|nr:hypothetical protein JTE90_010690 [Oedothorax gibbosus]
MPSVGKKRNESIRVLTSRAAICWEREEQKSISARVSFILTLETQTESGCTFGVGDFERLLLVLPSVGNERNKFISARASSISTKGTETYSAPGTHTSFFPTTS